MTSYNTERPHQALGRRRFEPVLATASVRQLDTWHRDRALGRRVDLAQDHDDRGDLGGVATDQLRPAPGRSPGDIHLQGTRDADLRRCRTDQDRAAHRGREVPKARRIERAERGTIDRRGVMGQAEPFRHVSAGPDTATVALPQVTTYKPAPIVARFPVPSVRCTVEQARPIVVRPDEGPRLPGHPRPEWTADSSSTMGSCVAGCGPTPDSRAAGTTMERATPTSTCSAAG